MSPSNASPSGHERSGFQGEGLASPWLHVAGLIALSAGFEALFLRLGLNPVDEGWPLYAAMQLEAGGQLYRDVFFVFPPGHLLCAWLGTVLDPPGLIGARILYAAFNVALVAASYGLARRLMPPAAAVLAAALIAVAATGAHTNQYLFGYRYLVWGVLALWCFSERLRGDDRRWMFAAGALAGAALLFRLTPALAVVAGIAVGVLARDPRPREVWADGSRAALGFLAVVVPTVAWLGAGVGLEKLWLEAVVRPIAMTDLQSLPVPDLFVPGVWSRPALQRAFVPLQFWLYGALYAGYAIALGALALRSARRGQRFEPVLLAAVATWAGLYFLRSFGRSDVAHLDSTVPATLLLVAHAASLPLRASLAAAGRPRWFAGVALLALFGLWVFVTGADRALAFRLRENPGTAPIETLEASTHGFRASRFAAFDRAVAGIRSRTRPGDVILDLTASSMLYVATGNRGPGYADVVMPGTFLSDEEERRFIERLEAAPPALVIAPAEPFDRMPSRAIGRWAPELTEWVRSHYGPGPRVGPWLLLSPRSEEAASVPEEPPPGSDTPR